MEKVANVSAYNEDILQDNKRDNLVLSAILNLKQEGAQIDKESKTHYRCI